MRVVHWLKVQRDVLIITPLSFRHTWLGLPYHHVQHAAVQWLTALSSANPTQSTDIADGHNVRGSWLFPVGDFAVKGQPQACPDTSLHS